MGKCADGFFGEGGFQGEEEEEVEEEEYFRRKKREEDIYMRMYKMCQENMDVHYARHHAAINKEIYFRDDEPHVLKILERWKFFDQESGSFRMSHVS